MSRDDRRPQTPSTPGMTRRGPTISPSSVGTPPQGQRLDRFGRPATHSQSAFSDTSGSEADPASPTPRFNTLGTPSPEPEGGPRVQQGDRQVSLNEAVTQGTATQQLRMTAEQSRLYYSMNPQQQAGFLDRLRASQAASAGGSATGSNPPTLEQVTRQLRTNNPGMSREEVHNRSVAYRNWLQTRSSAGGSTGGRS